MTLRLPAFLLALLLPLAATAMPHLDIDVRLDPASRRLEATATLGDSQGLAGFTLAPEFEITAMAIDGRRVSPRPDARGRHVLPAGSREVRIDYRATLAATAALDHRDVLRDRRPLAAPEGSFLPGAAQWYPDPGRRFAYRVALALPAGQKGLVPGDLLSESDGADGYRAEYRFPNPADGIDLMAGPYAVAERTLKLPGGRDVRLRTWFHAELGELSAGYLEDSARYIERYSRLIGDYPFGMFSVVSSPTPTGFGMPSLTYLGRDVIRLPFIRATSLGHEVLHNWWGNGVAPDWSRGNWSEGLTTFLADYAYKEDAGEDAAREMRLGWLRDLAAVPPGEDTALKDFTSRRHGISSIVGYNKAAMVFLMLRDTIGQEAFERGLRLLWERKRFKTAAWSDLEAAFAQAAGRPLRGFFRQWVERPGAPAINLEAAEQHSGKLRLRIAQSGPHALRLPVRLVAPGGGETRWIETARGTTTVTLPAAAGIEAAELDPDYRIWRRVDAALLPPILRETFVAPQARAVFAGDEPGARAAALALAARVLDARPERLEAQAPPASPLLLLGLAPAVDAWLARHGLPPRPPQAQSAGSAQVWAGRDAGGRSYAVISARDAASLKALERALPHYGKQSWLVFDGGRAAGKGVWPPRAALVTVTQSTR
ncbi:MAG: M1 family peptidase [Gammaproteobacteria bacterium]|nr:M1 family peptidase [Gammaproteobacteria bacterium]MBU1644982.1 M1 family peptidase [Gammaproteobacteria bacterium]MBU1971441.1 M1 family peptidase [Gammaproteobacteria bacterium]